MHAHVIYVFSHIDTATRCSPRRFARLPPFLPPPMHVQPLGSGSKLGSPVQMPVLRARRTTVTEALPSMPQCHSALTQKMPSTIIALPIGFATANPFALQEIWGCTNRGLIWSHDTGHQYIYIYYTYIFIYIYIIFKSNRISCREFVCINLCPLKSSLCAMLRLLLTKSPIIDETGCAMVILLPWCDFPWLPTTWCDFSVSPPCHGDDVIWCDFSRLMWLKYGVCIYYLNIYIYICTIIDLYNHSFNHGYIWLPRSGGFLQAQ